MTRRSLLTATTLLASLFAAPGLARAAEEPAKRPPELEGNHAG
jgi:hypothetical protein